MKYIVAELAGDDSLAAIYLYLQDNPNDIIIPTLVISPNEDQSNLDQVLNTYQKYIDCLQLKGYNIQNYWIISENKELWDRLISVPFVSPCIACHLYCHLLRLPLIKLYKGSLLTGERLQHGSNIKLNQNNLTLRFFDEIFSNYGYIKPLENISDTNIIREILKDIHLDKNIYVKCMAPKYPITQEELSKMNLEPYFKELKKEIFYEQQNL